MTMLQPRLVSAQRTDLRRNSRNVIDLKFAIISIPTGPEEWILQRCRVRSSMASVLGASSNMMRLNTVFEVVRSHWGERLTLRSDPLRFAQWATGRE